MKSKGRTNFMVYPGAQPFTIGASSTLVDSIAISDKAHFKACYLTGWVSDALTGGNESLGCILIQIRVGNRMYFNRPVLDRLLFGTGQNSNFFPVKLFLRKKETVLIDVQNTAVATRYLYFAFIGWEIEGD